MTMNNSVLKTLNTVMVLFLLSGLSSQLHADPQSRGLSYSPDHWPNRWSSAIRQQQGGKYPTRQLKQTPPPALPEEGGDVSEQDLFYSPSMRGRYGQRRGDRDQRSSRFDDQLPHYRQFRDARRESRRGAFAYYGMPALQHSNYMRASSGFPYGTSPIGMDPVLGHPGMGIPIMPGTPFGSPFAGYPYSGYPGGMGMWNPPFGAW